MKAMLLAAGRGERLRPLTDTVPKCMLRFENKPLLEHWIDKLRAVGVHEIVVNTHYLADVIEDYFGSGARWGVRMQYSRETELLGTAGALRNAQEFFSKERFLVIYADNQSTCSLPAMIEFHVAKQSLATMSVCWIEDPSSCGIVGFDASGRIRRFLEKPKPNEVFSHYINAGVYVFEPAIFDFLAEDGVSDFSRDVFPRMLQIDAPLFAYAYDGYVLKFDTFDDWKISQRIVAEEKRSGRLRFIVAVDAAVDSSSL